jgi:lysophospholipase L1-like esterase
MTLVLLLLLPLFAVSARDAGHAAWENDIRQFEAQDRTQPQPPGAVLFVGSSSIRFWKSLAQDFPDVRTINRGFGGSELDDSTYFAGRIVVPYKPRAIVLYAGDNDLMNGDTPERVRDDFVAFVARVRRDDPHVPIAFIAIKPSVARRALLGDIRKANSLIATWARGRQGVAYLDVLTPMLDAKAQPRPELFIEDGLHMNRKGYDIWIGLLRSWLDNLSHRT